MLDMSSRTSLGLVSKDHPTSETAMINLICMFALAGKETDERQIRTETL
jgi:hypothetical protein